MPIYENACEKCKHTFEQRQSMSEEPIKKCPKCGKKAVVRIMSTPGFRLIGEGFYKTNERVD